MRLTFFFEITIFALLTGCQVSPVAQPAHPSHHNAPPCKPDTVYVEVGSGAWWGVLPASDSFSLPGDPMAHDTTAGLWYWHTVNDTVKVPARLMRHAQPKPDTVRFPEIVYRDTLTGRWHVIADSLEQEIAMLESVRLKQNRFVGGFLSLLLLLVGAMLTYHYITFQKEKV